jgi:hypothetical protein
VQAQHVPQLESFAWFLESTERGIIR